MAIATKYRGTVYAHHGAVLRIRAVNESGDLLVSTDVTSVVYSIKKITNATDEGTGVTGHTNVTVTNAVLDTPGSWDLDTTGYNVRVPISCEENDPFPVRGGQYRVTITITTTGNHCVTIWEVSPL